MATFFDLIGSLVRSDAGSRVLLLALERDRVGALGRPGELLLVVVLGAERLVVLPSAAAHPLPNGLDRAAERSTRR